MPDLSAREAVAALDNAFADLARPEPLVSLEGAHCDAECRAFVLIDWPDLTPAALHDGMEGWILLSPEGFVYVLPWILRCALLRRDEDERIDDFVEDCHHRLVDPKGSAAVDRLSRVQKEAVVAAFGVLCRTAYAPSRSRMDRELAERFGLSG